jgi:hypothetical protein
MQQDPYKAKQCDDDNGSAKQGDKEEDHGCLHGFASLVGVQPKRRQVACTSVGFAYFNSLA